MAIQSNNIKSVKWKGIALTSVTDTSQNETGNVTLLQSDDSQTVNGIFVDDMHGVVRVTLFDSMYRSASFALGTVGKLEIHSYTKSNGTTANPTISQTQQYADACITDVSDGRPSQGNATFVVTFIGVGLNGRTFVTY